MKTKKNNKISNNKTYKKVQCSPSNKNLPFTCYSNDSLHKMKYLWNIRHPSDKILTNDIKEIWQQFKQKLQNVCNRESCWMRSKFMEGNIDRQLLNYTFAPSAPKDWSLNPNEWLSSDDIMAVMKQYEHVYKCFEIILSLKVTFKLIIS